MPSDASSQLVAKSGWIFISWSRWTRFEWKMLTPSTFAHPSVGSKPISGSARGAEVHHGLIAAVCSLDRR